jgi:hypothetical protein
MSARASVVRAVAPLALALLVGCAADRASAPIEQGERYWSTVDETLALEWPLANGTNVRLDSAKGVAEPRPDGTFEFALDLHWRLSAANADGNPNAFSAVSRVRLAFEPTAATWFTDGAEQGLLVAGLTRTGVPIVERIVLGRPRERMEFDSRGGLHIAGVVPGEPRGVSRCFVSRDGALPAIRGLLPRLPGAPAEAFHVITSSGESTWSVHTVTGSNVTFVGSTEWDLRNSYSAHSIVDVDGRWAHRLAPTIELLSERMPLAIDFVDTDADGLVDRVQELGR